MNPTLKRWGLVCIAPMFVVAALVAVVGFAHTDAGRPLLHWMAKAAGCPADLDGGDPVKVEAFRVDALKERDGEGPALSHPALSFQLGRTTRSDVVRWAAESAASCEATRRGSVLSCEVAAPVDQLPIEDLHLQFDSADRLVAVDLFRAHGCGRDAVTHLRRLGERLSASVGPSTRTRGTLSADYLAHAYRRAAIEYRYARYTAQISAINLGARGIRVREQYQWAPEG